jgi:glutathione S-transferase
MTDTPLTLYGHPDSGHSYKVGLFLRLAKLPYKYVRIDVFKPLAAREPEFQAASRFGEVPVLVRGDLRISQSNAILIYLAELTGRFRGTDARSWTAIHEWLFWEMSRLNFGVANLRYALRFEPGAAPGAVALYRSRSEEALRRLEQEIALRRFLVGDELTIADLSCSGYLFWANEADIDLGRYPAVARWLGDISAQEGWRPAYELLN